MGEIVTDRLLLRELREGDLDPIAAMNADPRVMEYFPSTLSRAENDAFAGRVREHLTKHGFSFWVVESRADGQFLGLTGLLRPRFVAHFTPCVEIGWRFAAAHWGKGYATEAAKASLRFGFDRLGLSEIVAYTVPQNQRSRRVMEKLGMSRSSADDFDHPSVPEHHPLRRHVLYRLRRPISR